MVRWLMSLDFMIHGQFIEYKTVVSRRQLPVHGNMIDHAQGFPVRYIKTHAVESPVTWYGGKFIPGAIHLYRKFIKLPAAPFLAAFVGDSNLRHILVPGIQGHGNSPRRV